jgi:hypothetical protein
MQPITEKELKDAINSINRRKSADYYNITIDIFLFSSADVLFASSTGRAAFLGDAPFVKPLCEVFCIF